ncbi:MAG: hypothetical protein LBI13_08180 [Streptococcaceae bacterium]|jgi:hypothetical protein|nr:hypothetical protein [Streptococcaceae bacterium]
MEKIERSSMNLTISWKKLYVSSSNARWVLFVMAYFIIAQTLVIDFNLNRIILYFGDILNVFVFLKALYNRRLNNKGLVIPELFMLVFIVLGIIISLVQKVSPLLIFWGVRNNAGMFLFFYSCVTFFKRSDYKIIFRWLAILFWISLPLAMIEVMFLAKSGQWTGDMTGGIIFGAGGASGFLNVVISFYLAYVAVRFFKQEVKFSYFLFCILSSAYIAALGEIRVFFIEIILIIVFAAIFSGTNRNTVFRVLISLIVLIALMYGMTDIFIAYNASQHTNYASSFLLSNFFNNAISIQGYNGLGGGELNRLSGIGQLMSGVMNENVISQTFGFGLGSAEFNNFFSSPFYRTYSYLSYQWFSDLWMFIEMGFVGIFIYLTIFVSSFRKVNHVMKKSIERAFTKVGILLMILLFIYNVSLRDYSTAYFLFSLLALPYVVAKNKISKEIL